MEKNNTEQLVIMAAKQVFIEKGYAETSMSDIAIKAGINRPALHYYFRTKEKMFEAVFADIVHSFVPSIQEVLLMAIPIDERIVKVVDIYFETMQWEPLLPMFVLREVQRDALHLLNTARKIETIQYMGKIGAALEAEMSEGKIRRVPVEFVFYTFYGLLFAPFLSKPLTDVAFNHDNENFADRLCEWKEQVVRQMKSLLCP